MYEILETIRPYVAQSAVFTLFVCVLLTLMVGWPSRRENRKFLNFVSLFLFLSCMAWVFLTAIGLYFYQPPWGTMLFAAILAWTGHGINKRIQALPKKEE